MSDAPGKRVLFALSEPGYFRFYGSTIVELAQRGWDVDVAFDKPDKRKGEPVPKGAAPRVRSVGMIPEVAGGTLSLVRSAMDYFRYLEAPYRGAAYLRRRSEKTLPPAFGVLTRVSRTPRFVVGAAIRALRLVERLVPPDAGIVEWLRQQAPDVVFVSPMVILGPRSDRQTEIVKAGRALGVPVIVGVASWDHLTSKGLVRVVPDALMVWNDAQATEAVDLHRIPRASVVVTGAQSLDHWFTPVSPQSTAAFRVRLGIPEGRKVILFVGSSKNIAPGATEPGFVRRWTAALRSASHPDIRSAVLLVRPHPGNTEPWRDVPLDPDVRVYPSSYSGIPLTAGEIEDFRQSLVISDAVVGVNTTAMIEAAIFERPVLTIRDSEFAHSQDQTLHFGHLAVDAGGCALVAQTLDEHVAQLERVTTDPSAAVARARAFVQRFVRPRGISEPVTQHVCREIERIADGRSSTP